MNSRSPVEEIKQRLGIEEVVGSYIELKQAGKALKALCPFHSEKTPSFTVSTERQSFYCFGCNRGGDIFTFVEEFEGVDFKGALKILAERANVDLRLYRGTAGKKENKKELDRLYQLLEKTKILYQKELKATKSAQDYITKRGITKESTTQFEIGFAPDSWSYILDKLLKDGFTSEEINKAGLVIKKEGGGFYDRFRNRIMFPISDSSGRVVGFSGRTLESNTEKTAKYINSPETGLFKKRDILYGIDKSKLAIRKLGFSILVEGQMDLVLSHQAGFRNTVATSGTALRGRDDEGESGVSNLELVKRISKNIVIAFDADSAGNKAVIKNARLALSLGMDVKIAELPDGMDPADVIREDKKKWKQIIKESMDAIEFQLKLIEKNSKNRKSVLKAVREELFPTIQSIPSHIEREHYLHIVSEVLGVRNETLLSEFEAVLRKPVPEAHKPNDSTSKNIKESKEKEEVKGPAFLATHIVLFENQKETAEQDILKFQEQFKEIFNESPKVFLKQVPPSERERYAFEIEAENMTALEQGAYIEYLLKHITIGELKQKANLLLQKLKEAEDEADKEAAEKIFGLYSSILTKLEKLKQNL